MRQYFQKIKIVDRTPELKEFDFRRPNGKISCKTDQHFNVLLFDIELDESNKRHLFT